MDVTEELNDTATSSTTTNDRSNKEYNIWRNNVPYLYDLLISEKLDSPSRTVELLPGGETEGDHIVQRMVLGSGFQRGMNFLRLSSLKLPKADAEYDAFRFENDGFGSFGPITGKISHEVEMHRKQIAIKGRYMPQKPNIIAALSSNACSMICVSDTKAYGSETRGDVSASVILSGLTTVGTGLAWNKIKEGTIASTSNNKLIGIWDLKQNGVTSQAPVVTLKGHTDAAMELDWHPKCQTLMSSVGKDKSLLIWDTRSQTPMIGNLGDRSFEMTCVAFNPGSDYIVVTGSMEKCLHMWDLRTPRNPLHKFGDLDDPVHRIQWKTDKQTILASSAGNLLHVWDMAKIGEEQTPEEAEDGPPELVFVHAGHCRKITDFSYSPTDPELIASVSEDAVQVWKMTDYDLVEAAEGNEASAVNGDEIIDVEL